MKTLYLATRLHLKGTGQRRWDGLVAAENALVEDGWSASAGDDQRVARAGGAGVEVDLASSRVDAVRGVGGGVQATVGRCGLFRFEQADDHLSIDQCPVVGLLAGAVRRSIATSTPQ